MPPEVIAERDFSQADQEWFAAVSGDINPMHMDPVAARRTLARFPVVHGIHGLLWALDSLFRTSRDLASFAGLKVSFTTPIHVGDHVQALLVQRDARRLRLNTVVDGITVMEAVVLLVAQSAAGETAMPDEPILRPEAPVALSFEQMTLSQGRVPFPAKEDELGRAFPDITRALGVRRVGALACSSFLVGMVCPGLHSLYRGLDLATAPMEDVTDDDALRFRVGHSDERFRLVRLAVSGGGWTGSIETQARPEPAPQAALPSIAARVEPGEFRGVSALVVGGSRGLGELVAKILAAGGAHLTLTYAVGEADARRVQAEIARHGGDCDIMQYDVQSRVRQQLDHLGTKPNQLYYMATPAISRRRRKGFIEPLFQEFFAFYVTAFYELCRDLVRRHGNDLAILYPSSVFVDDRPAGMTEYAMAKACGEALCADMQEVEKLGHIVVRRLPRLPTDQTAAMHELDLGDPIDIILPVIREVCRAQNGRP